MNYDANSSSSSDDYFDDMVTSIVTMNACLENEENYIIQNAVQYVTPFVFANQGGPPTERKKRAYIERDRDGANEILMNDYFVDRPLYPEAMFRRRYRMRRSLFLRIVEAVAIQDPYFQQTLDATGKLGATAIQKCTAAIRMLAYGTSADLSDEYLKINDSTTRKCLKHFVSAVRKTFTEEYLRRPIVNDLQRLLQDGARRGFPGMMGSIDCMHWEWKNCPRAWKGLYQGRNKSATVILEVVASGDLWIWHAFFGTPGTCNDINVLHRSPVFDDLYKGTAPEVTYNVNGHTYNKGYYLTDGIYPKWAVFIPAIRLPLSQEDELFTKRQESVRKDVERIFGVFRGRFGIIQKPARGLSEALLWETMLACIILHNMIVEDERDTYQNYQDTTEFEEDNIQNLGETSMGPTTQSFTVQPGRYNNLGLQQYMQRRTEAWDRDSHTALQRDLVQHIWQQRGEMHDN